MIGSGRASAHRLLQPVAAVATLYILGALLWLALGDALPGGRWFAVHLFTLGVLTNLIVALTHHFAQTLLHARRRGPRTARFVLLNVGLLLMLGFPPSLRWPFAAGATLMMAAVAWLLADLRRMRKASLVGRLAFIVRTYEWACGAFLLGATLGALMGVGLLGGWHGAGRLAHLHVNILGWGGLTLLATVTFFGPTVMGTQAEPGADRRAAVALRYGVMALTVGVLALLLTGTGGDLALAARLAAAAALAGYAVAATVVCVAVVSAGRRARPTAQARMMRAACSWFVAVVWADVAVVATGRWRLLDALGAVLIVGVLGQAILAAMSHLAPMLAAAPRAGGLPAGTAVRARLGRASWVRAALLNAGVLAVGAAAVAGRGAGDAGALVGRAGWALVAAAVLVHLALVVWGLLVAHTSRVADAEGCASSC
jgi:hypothetical protein